MFSLSNLPKQVSDNQRNVDNDEHRAFVLIEKIILVGIFAILLYAFRFSWIGVNGSETQWVYIITIFAVALLIAGASLIIGALTGFLFAIPKSLQEQGVIATNNTTGYGNDVVQYRNPVNYGNNDNLVQISDWLTKIIVGVGLTQLTTIPERVYKLQVNLENVLGTPAGRDEMAGVFGVSVIIYFLVSGFIYSYMWSRLNLMKLFVNSDVATKKLLEQLNIKGEKLQESINLNKQAVSKSEKLLASKDEDRKQDELEKIKKIVAKAEIPFKSVIEKAKPEDPTVYFDSQKGRWGGDLIQNGISIKAKVEALTDSLYYNVTLTVESIDVNNILTGKVYFFLHESYEPMIVMVNSVNGKAIHTFKSIEAFTVGAYCENSNTKLELDINEAQDLPAGYSYKKEDYE